MQENKLHKLITIIKTNTRICRHHLHGYVTKSLFNLHQACTTPQQTLCIGATDFRGKFCQILQASSQNSAAHRNRIVQILRLITAFHLCITKLYSVKKTSLFGGWHDAQLC